ncbi:MAG TPA: bifunctional riboflavin kinase/FAD synthetase [Microbacteriaceae bacterium]|nr:bifunctional riboflavin kinase/FAD synthetase [Microbacteriaceae bacterium]
MRVVNGLPDAGAFPRATAVAIGKFDGVHRGHRNVLGALRTRAELHVPELETVVVTFDRHPLAHVNPSACPELLSGPTQQIQAFDHLGLDACVVLEFSAELAALSAHDFVAEILVERLRAALVVVGADFRFGAGGIGDAALLEALGAEYGFEVAVIADVVDDGGRLSSTRIRTLLESGSVAEAAGLLDRLPSVRGEVVHGAARGRELGFPTANLSPEAEGYIPADGVYAGWLTVDGRRLAAAISIGNNPTFEGVPQRQVEAYVIDETLDLYGKIVDVEFQERLRGMKAFDSIEALIAQMAEDVALARTLLS